MKIVRADLKTDCLAIRVVIRFCYPEVFFGNMLISKQDHIFWVSCSASQDIYTTVWGLSLLCREAFLCAKFLHGKMGHKLTKKKYNYVHFNKMSG